MFLTQQLSCVFMKGYSMQLSKNDYVKLHHMLLGLYIKYDLPIQYNDTIMHWIDVTKVIAYVTPDDKPSQQLELQFN